MGRRQSTAADINGISTRSAHPAVSRIDAKQAAAALIHVQLRFAVDLAAGFYFRTAEPGIIDIDRQIAVDIDNTHTGIDCGRS